MKRALASAIAILVMCGCAGVKPTGELTGGLPGVASATVLLSRDASPAEVAAAHDADLKQCLERQNALTDGNPCLCLAAHPDRAMLASMHGFQHCFAQSEPEAQSTACPAPPACPVVEPRPCPAAVPPVCPTLPESPASGHETGYVMPAWCESNGDSPYCIEIAKRYAAEKVLEAYRDRMSALSGCERIVGKDGYHVSGKVTYACDTPASEVLDGDATP